MAARKVFAREIVAYSDEELNRYLEETGRFVRVHDRKNLPDSFIQRLRDRVHNASRSRPVDLGQVSARLLQTSPKRHASPERRARRHGLTVETAQLLGVFDQSSSEDPSTPGSSEDRTPDPEEEYQRNVAWEREFHDELVNDGGQPWYPIHLLEEVSRNPREHRELLQAWQPFPDAQPDDWIVFGRQLGRWRLFREWQAKRRKEFEGRSLSEYNQWAKRFLLGRHSYTAPVEFEFKKDPKQQDKLTTWIEYLTYEHNFYTGRYAWYKRREKWYDKQWKKLVDSGVLRPHETEEFIWRPESAFQRDSEEIQGGKAVESARSAVLSAQQAVGDPSRPSASARRRLAAAQSKLDSAIQSFESIKRLNNLIGEFKGTTRNYRDAKSDAERHTILLQWIREQVSLIELESKQSKVAESSSDAGRGSSRGVKCGGADEATEEQSKKRQKHHDEEPLSTRSTATRFQGQALKRSRGDISVDNEPPSKRPRCDVGDSNAHNKPFTRADATARLQDARAAATAHTRSTDVHGSPAVSKPLRRSARIASRQNPSRIAVAPPHAVRSSRQGSRRKVAQVLTPPSSIGSQDRQSRSLATKTSLGRGTGGSSCDVLNPEGVLKRGRRQRQPDG